MVGAYSSLKKETKEGFFTWYYENGKPSRSCEYYRGKEDGLLTEWNEDGKKIGEIYYKKGLLNGEAKRYYPDGTLKRYDIYKLDKLVEGHCYDKHSKEVGYYPLFEMPVYLGGDDSLLSFIVKNFVYPESAKEEGIGGRVKVQLDIMKDGSVDNVRVVKGVNDEIDKESIRVIKKLNKWNPAKYDGEPVDVKIAIPIFSPGWPY